MLALLLSAALALQDTATARLVVPAPAADSTGVLTFDAFYREVLADHPVVRQAQLLDERARAEVLAAKGGVYDPTVSAAWSRKVFSGTEYYDYVDAALKVPTPVGIDLKLGYEQASGAYINPDRRTPSSGLFVAGVTIPVGRGLVTDSRRNALAQAKALGTLAAAERQGAVNKLLYSATREYAAWFEAWRRRAIIREGVALARFRLEAVTRRYDDGDAAAIDTVEAGLEYQRRLVTQLEADNDWYLATQAINAYLWDAQSTPVDLVPGVVPSVHGLEPEALDTTAVSGWLSRAMLQHPELTRALARLRQEQANRRFYGQDLLPELEVEAAALRTGAGGIGAGWPEVGENYKLGAFASTPLLLMKGRGRLDASKAKAESAELEAALVRRDVRLAVLVAVNEVLTVERILALQAEAVRQARFLRDGEQRRFENSESTLFLVNQRDRLLLDEQLKLVAFEAKYVKARAALALALGEPGSSALREPVPDR